MPWGFSSIRTPRSIRACSSIFSVCYTEKIDEHALIERGVLIDENPHGIPRFERFQDTSRRILLFNDVIAGQTAITFDQRVDSRIVDGTYNNMHRRRHPRMCECAKFPVAQVRGGDQDPAAS